MLDIEQILDTIKELENSDTTFDNCIKLASLYIVRNNYPSDNVENELDDILPCYNEYLKIKKEYQLGKTNKEQVITSMELVCKEIKEFIRALYSGTDMQEERDLLERLVTTNIK